MANADIIKDPSRAKDKFFLTGIIHQRNGMCHIFIPPGGLTVSQNDDGSDSIPRKIWDNPEERKNMGGTAPDIRLLGAGGIVSVTTSRDLPGQSPRVFLTEKTFGPSNGRLKEPAGLCDAHPILTAYTEIAEETGLTILDEHALSVRLVLPVPPRETLLHVFGGNEKIAAYLDSLVEAKKAQIDYIRGQLPQHARKWPIEVVRHPLTDSPEDSRYTDNVLIEIEAPPVIGGVNQTNAHAVAAIAVDNPGAANFNILLPVRLHFDLAPGQTIHAVDPENLGDPSPRPVHLTPRDDMIEPDFIKDRASVTMRPFLNRAWANEKAPQVLKTLAAAFVPGMR